MKKIDEESRFFIWEDTRDCFIRDEAPIPFWVDKYGRIRRRE